jgi:hypothetical protein
MDELKPVRAPHKRMHLKRGLYLHGADLLQLAGAGISEFQNAAKEAEPDPVSLLQRYRVFSFSPCA